MLDPFQRQALDRFKHWIDRHELKTARDVPDWERIGTALDVSGRQVKRWYDGETPIPRQLETAMMMFDFLKVKAQYDLDQSRLPKVKRENPAFAQVMELGSKELMRHMDNLARRVADDLKRAGSAPFWIPTDGKDKA